MDAKTEKQKLLNFRMMLQSWFHSRKAFIFLAVFVVASVLCAIGRVDGGQWVDVVKWAATAYMAANVGDGVAQALAGRKDVD